MQETKSYSVQQALAEDIEQIISFNESMYPSRTDALEFFDYRFLNERAIADLSGVIVAKHGDKIIGQRMALKQLVAYNEKTYESCWVNDMIVDPEYRGIGVAKELVKKMIEVYPSFSSLNTGEQSIQIYKKLGSVSLRNMNLYLKPLSLPAFASFMFNLFRKKEFHNHQKNPSITFPDDINDFVRIRNANDIKNPNYNWNENIVEVVRTKDFLDWRFFFKPGKFGFYQLNSPLTNDRENKAYFVVRTIIWKGMKCLMMADARYRIGSNEDVLIKKAVLKIAKQNKLDGVLWGTSVVATQKKLKKSGFIKYSELPMTSNLKISETDFDFMAHFADSDLEFNYSNTPFIYGQD